MHELCELLDIHKVKSSPYHPICNGMSERFNRTIQTIITSYVNQNQTNWDQLLPSLVFAYNTVTHSTTKTTPFELTYGRKPKVPVDFVFPNVELNLHLTSDNYAENVKHQL